MPEDERRIRMKELRRVVEKYDIAEWGEEFGRQMSRVQRSLPVEGRDAA